MAFKYTSMTKDPERSPLYTAFNQTEKLDDLEDSYVPLSETTKFADSDTQLFGTTIKSYGIWMVHLMLLLTSFTLFIFGTSSRSNSTLDYVRQFSAWCESYTSERRDELDCVLTIL
ncbi:hypothetical protein EIK77_000788 [Talaromyces pinophilus]|nr:hypothetical protein EIK77_000788 [Talaromyces pinophilus]